MKKPVTGQENIRLLTEKVRVRHLMVEAVGGIVEILISEEVNIDETLGFIHAGNLEGNETYI